MQRVRDRERSKRKITPTRVIKEEIEELDEKPLYRPSSGKMIHQKISWDT